MTKATRVNLPKEPTRKQQSRAEREARQQRYLLIGVAVVLVVVVGLVLFGVFNERVLIPRQPVAKVGDTVITTEAFQKRVRYQQYSIVNRLSQLRQQRYQFENDPNLKFLLDQIDQQIAQLQSSLDNPGLLGKQVLDAMVDEILVRQEAARRNVTVSPAEVTDYIEQQFFGYYRVPPTPAPTRTPLPTPSVPVTVTPQPTLTPVPSPTPISEADYKSAYNNYLSVLAKQAGMNESDLRALVESQLLRDKVLEAFKAEAPATTDAVKLRYVQPENQVAIEYVGGLLQSGMAFNQLYADVQSGKVISTTQGEIDWMPVEDLAQRMGQAIVDQLLVEPVISRTTGLVTDTYGIAYVLQVVERDKAHPLDDYQKQSKGQAAFDAWLSAQRLTPDLVDYLNDRYLDAVVEFKLVP